MYGVARSATQQHGDFVAAIHSAFALARSASASAPGALDRSERAPRVHSVALRATQQHGDCVAAIHSAFTRAHSARGSAHSALQLHGDYVADTHSLREYTSHYISYSLFDEEY